MLLLFQLLLHHVIISMWMNLPIELLLTPVAPVSKSYHQLVQYVPSIWKTIDIGTYTVMCTLSQ